MVFVRHDSVTLQSPLRPYQPGNTFKAIITGEPDLLMVKSVNSSFHGIPDLAEWLHRSDIRAIAICGITTNHCCETTARVASNLGFDTWFVLDATHTFDRADLDGVTVSADMLARITATNLDGEFAHVLNTADALERIVC